MAAQSLVRFIITKTNPFLPDMAEGLVWYSQVVFAIVRVGVIYIIFRHAGRSLSHRINLIDESDQMEMAALQREVFGSGLSVLTGDSILRLVQLWGFILIGVQIIFDISSILYRIYIANLSAFFLAGGWVNEFVIIYNYTHGFKYAGMLIAIIIGIMATGIFLDDRWLKYTSVAIAFIYLLSFAFVQIHDINIFGKTVGIVLSSVVFHVIETLGLAGLAIYLRKRYLGL
ncbi:MAG: hypothetical protein K5770_18940 [Lachnospiraceae bacterium]|nr:hypothetical protein [Lachnospiraceae bacterium]